jgi:8-oxo-dGTP diphosphatase
MQLQIGVKVLIQNSNNEYLFLQRSQLLSSDVKSSWDIPGGRINPDEYLDDALVREVFEETGATLDGEPRLLAAQDIFVNAKDLHVVRLTYSMVADITNIILSDEHQDYTWRQLDDVADLYIEPYLKEVIGTLVAQDA